MSELIHPSPFTLDEIDIIQAALAEYGYGGVVQSELRLISGILDKLDSLAEVSYE